MFSDFSTISLALSSVFSTSAMAADMSSATEGDCAAMRVKVNSALDANQSSANFADAKKESTYGQEFCTNAMYKTGVSHYAQALKLLGASAS